MSRRRLFTRNATDIFTGSSQALGRKRLCKIALLLLLACGSTVAQSLLADAPRQIPSQQANFAERADRRLHRNRTLWLVSIPVFLAANILDAHSSWGKPEQNVFLQGQSGRFDGRSVSIKLGLAGGIIGGEYSLIRLFRKNHQTQNGAYATSAWSNFIGGGALAAVAVHNYRAHAADSSRSLK